MAATQQPSDEAALQKRTVETIIRVGVIVVLIAWCFLIVWPFVTPLVWGVIIAMATYSGYRWLLTVLGGRRVAAASVYSLVMLILLIGPMVVLAETLVDGARQLAEALIDGRLTIPPPPDGVRDWPLIGEPVQKYWSLASEDISAALSKIAPQLRALGRWLLSVAAGVGFGVLQFVFAIVIAGILVVHAGGGRDASLAIATRLAGDRGRDYIELARSTVRSVARGILGVSLIQTGLAGLGFLAVGIPGAGFLALICLLFSVVQIGVFPVLIPVVIYVFVEMDTMTAILFTVWNVIVGFTDNALKPLLLGRGVKVPMPVIFIGAIGGLLTSGIVGLFVGPVVLALGYTLFLVWLDDGPEQLPGHTGPDTPASDSPARRSHD
ncbi:MAG: AI-2E family transporter [Alphaproteobacteria bacterium]|nr:AI-2E family transporter [Alphaproteobacteria bacterium]